MAEQNLDRFYKNPYLFNAKELDRETGLYYYGARYYNPKLSVWYGVDPLAEKHPNESPYVYTSDNPVMFTDPTGMEPDDWYQNDDIIDIDKKTGHIKVTKAKGKDIVRMIDNGKVVDNYTYGENGSFKNENKLITGKFTNSEGKSDEGQSIVSANNTKAFKFFKFAAKSDVEFSYNKYINVDTNKSVSVVATSHDKGREDFGVMVMYSFLTTTKNINLVNSWHSHPGTYDKSTGWPAYPSGFYYNGKIRSGETGDRDGYNWNRKYFPKRTPLYNYIYIPSANKFVKYNGKTFKVK